MMTQYVYEIDMRAERDYLLKKYRAARAELAQARDDWAHEKIKAHKFEAALTDACAARDALARECNKVAGLLEERGVELTNACTRQGVLRRGRDFWLETCRAAEAERDQIRKEAQEQSDEVQARWLSPVEAEGLRRQLKQVAPCEEIITLRTDLMLARVQINCLRIEKQKQAEGETAIVEAAEAYLAQRKHRHLVMDEDCKNLQDVLEHRSDAAAKLLERLAEAEAARNSWEMAAEGYSVARDIEYGKRREAEAKRLHWFGIAQEQAWRLAALDAAEAALADCNLGGVETKFNGLPNAIEEMAEHIKELSGQLSEAELAAHVLRESCFVLAQKVRTERALRQEAEREREAMSEMARDRGSRLRIVEQRAERAEALAALVNEEAADLLEHMAQANVHVSDAYKSNELAAQIRQALEVNDES